MKHNKVPKLTIELVPETCWFTNVRSEVSKDDWDFLRKRSYMKALYKCEICGGKGKDWPVECHEIWHYDEQTYTQKLEGLIALCPSCHEVKHLGRACSKGHDERALKHLAKVNDWDIDQATDYAIASFRLWQERSEHEWHLDLSFLKQFSLKSLNTTDKESANVRSVNTVKPLSKIEYQREDVVEAEIVDDEDEQLDDVKNLVVFLEQKQAESKPSASRMPSFLWRKHWQKLLVLVVITLGVASVANRVAAHHKHSSSPHYRVGDCTSYSRNSWVDGHEERVHGRVCLGADRHWHVV